MKKYLIVKSEKYIVLKMDRVHDSKECRVFEEEAVKEIYPANLPLIVDCKNLELLMPQWIRGFLHLQAAMKKKGQVIKFVHVSPQVELFFKKEGVDAAFNISRTMKDALSELGLAQKRSLNMEFINPFLEATLHVLKVQASIEATPGKIAVKGKEEPHDIASAISGMIGVASTHFNGLVRINFPEQTFLKIINGMLGEEYKEVSPDLLSGAGEITNMIFGQAKMVLNEKGYGLEMALPSVCHGSLKDTAPKVDGPTVIVPFDSQAGQFKVEISLGD